MRVTMGVDVDAGTRAERIAVDARSDLRDRERHGSKRRFAPGLAQAVLSRWWSGLATARVVRASKWCPGTRRLPEGSRFFLIYQYTKV